jgi:hypothetical protein
MIPFVVVCVGFRTRQLPCLHQHDERKWNQHRIEPRYEM